ncbi:MAG: trehalose-6-phosphate synthase, partial [Anaerolineaceae bacterium]|nr:trehalose-6-phosphate synthase [Anaerolineaceae bacterium]
MTNNPDRSQECQALEESLLNKRGLIIVANRGPMRLARGETGELNFQRISGGLVNALLGLARHVDATWIANAASDTDREWRSGFLPVEEGDCSINVEFLCPEQEVYDKFYNVISNPLLWFLQHSMWDFVSAPTIDLSTWDAWNQGYVQMNLEFAEAIARHVKKYTEPVVVMFQDYHLYLAPRFLRMYLRGQKRPTLLHFIHIPWPGPETWGILPPPMREAILQGLCSIDLLGFQTKADAINFIRTVESFLPRARVNYRQGRIWFRNHTTHVRDFPISIDVGALRELADSQQVALHQEQLKEYSHDMQLIVRVDRCEPSKNIVRGFQAFDRLLERFPEHRGKVRFLAILVPSRMAVEEYQKYLDEVMAAAGRINARYGGGDWEAVRVLVGDDYPRAIAALQMYDVLLVNPIADGMNLVAKEGPIVNQRDGVLILSERAGAAQQLGSGALVISPCDIYNTCEALHQALTMPEAERKTRRERL